MSREEIQKLLGGYATGTLTGDEQQALFEAALEDQELFDALAHEQALRDLLRDPVAKATVLAELDGRAVPGWKAWLRRPWVAGLAMAAVAVVAVGVWQFGRKPIEKPVLVAENRPAPPPAVAPPVAQDQPATPRAITPLRSEIGPKSAKLTFAPSSPAPSAAPPPPPPAATPAPVLEKDKGQDKAKAEAETKPVAPIVADKKSFDSKEQVQVQAQAPLPLSPQSAPQQSLGASVASPAVPLQDARDLFFQSEVTSGGRMAFAPQVEEQSKTSGAGGSNVTRLAKQSATAGAAGVMMAGRNASVPLAALNPGVRCSILRDGKEADPSTPVAVGEAVKLKLTPNADGFLYVMEDEKLVAGGPVRRLVPFETPELKRDTPGERYFRVTLTRAPLTVGALARQDAAAPADLVETKGEREAATYVVQTGKAAAVPQVILPVTLTWR
jgi:hypothetical protein